LEELLGSRNVYYQPPGSFKMTYPAIRYSKKNMSSKFANNKIYSNMKCYELIVIDKNPDNPVIDKLLELPYCSYSNFYISDNLNHDVLTIYY
jgi:hypothetical protein